MGATPTFDLYLDDSGSRYPDRHETREDGIDAFALGGLLVAAEEAGRVIDAVKAIRAEFGLTCPLHSNPIRTKKDGFAWLGTNPEKAREFLERLERLLGDVPGWATACVVHRPGYNARYKQTYGDKRWKLCKTAYQIVVERCAKFAGHHGRRLKVFVEQTGKHEDSAIREYHRQALAAGLEFDVERSAKYGPLPPARLAEVTLSQPHFIKKDNEIGQIADLLLYPIVKGRYDAGYRTFSYLCSVRKLMDYHLPAGLPECGVKFSCFDGPEFEGFRLP